MTDVFFGKDLLDNREQIESLPEQFYALIDPEGTNVIIEHKMISGGHYLQCLMKFRDRSLPFEAYITLSDDLYKKIVMTMDIKSLTTEVH